jgi:hypothetical protein
VEGFYGVEGLVRRCFPDCEKSYRGKEMEFPITSRNSYLPFEQPPSWSVLAVPYYSLLDVLCVWQTQVRAQYRLSDKTLKQWAEDGRVGCVVSPGGRRMYSINDLHALFGRSTGMLGSILRQGCQNTEAQKAQDSTHQTANQHTDAESSA